MWLLSRNSSANDALFIPSSFLLLLAGLIYLGKSHISASFLSTPGPDPWDLPMKQIYPRWRKKPFTSSLNIWPEAWGGIQRETLCMGPYARFQHIYHAQPFAVKSTWSRCESTLSPSQGQRIWPLLEKDVGVGEVMINDSYIIRSAEGCTVVFPHRTLFQFICSHRPASWTVEPRHSLLLCVSDWPYNPPSRCDLYCDGRSIPLALPTVPPMSVSLVMLPPHQHSISQQIHGHFFYSKDDVTVILLLGISFNGYTAP